MRKMGYAFLVVILNLSLAAHVVAKEVRCMEVNGAAYGQINARGLKALIDSQLPFVLLDARGDKWHDENIIPGAKLASYGSSPEELETLIPNKESLIVIYCYSPTCPLGPRLAQKLVDLGYCNVLEFSAGLKEWRDRVHYPVEVIQA